MQIQTIIQEGAELVWRGTKHSMFPLALETTHWTCSALQEQLKGPLSFKASSIFCVD